MCTRTLTERRIMKEIGELKLHGFWASPYSERVEVALKLKGIPYTYIEEDLSNKSQSLLQYNPIHKKVPVLVYNEKPICESLIILEFIDEHWKDSPKLLPEDLYARSKARFWANFYDQDVSPFFVQLLRSEGEKQKEVVEAYFQKIDLIEKHCFGEDFAGKSPFLHGETLGYLDLVMGLTACYLPAASAAMGIELKQPDRHPMFEKWINEIEKHQLVKESLPDYVKLVDRMNYLKAKLRNQPKP